MKEKLQIPWPITTIVIILVLNLWIHNSLYETLSATLTGVFLGFFLAQEMNKSRRKENLVAQLTSLAHETGANEATLKMIQKGLDEGFILDRLSYDTVNSILLNSDLYQLAHIEFASDLIFYKKTVIIANNAIDFCFERWKDKQLTRINKIMLLDKFKSVYKAQSLLSPQVNQLQKELKK